jgi:cytochrome c553
MRFGRGFLGVGFGMLLASCVDSETTTGDPLDATPPTTPPAATAGTGVYAQVCAACHGVNGEGKEELHSPSITGLPTWYLEEQVKKFRSGSRGFHPGDLPGQQMRAISLALTDAQIAEAAATVASMQARPTEAPPPGFDLETARYRYANECMECHRYNGKGEIVFHSAPLISLNRSYLRRQLFNFRAGKRGATEGDLYGAKMVENMKSLTDAEIEMFVNYIGALAHGDDPRSAREK